MWFILSIALGVFGFAIMPEGALWRELCAAAAFGVSMSLWLAGWEKIWVNTYISSVKDRD